MGRLVLLRHGESIWNKKKIFTGWVDVSLSARGIEEAFQAGEKIKDISFDAVYVSGLVRAEMTGFLALSKNRDKRVPVLMSDESKGLKDILPVYVSSALNERHYGELQGKSKDEVEKEVGETQYKLWRRSYDVAPPKGESLKMTIERTLPFFIDSIIPHMERGENVLIAAHGNSLRGVVMYLDKLTPEEVTHLEIPTGEPLFYQYEKGMWKK